MAVTDYLRGAGTSADPYIIHNAAAWSQFFNVDKNSGKYFEVVADIDCNGATLTGVYNFTGSLNGNGFKVSNFKSNSPYWFNTSNYSKNISITNIHISGTYTGSDYPLAIAGSVYVMKCTNVRFDIAFTNAAATMFYDMLGSTSVMTNVVLNIIGPNPLSGTVQTVTYSGLYAIADKVSQLNITGITKLSGPNAYLPGNYPSLGIDWIMNGVSIPYLAKNGRPTLTQKYAIKGSTKVGGIAKKRKIAVLTAAYLGVLKNIYTADDGTYLIDMGDVYDPVYVMHYDDYGFPLAANAAYTLNSYIHPKTPNGYRYKCTSAGTSGAELPAEPWPTSSNLTSGTAIFTPEPVYKTETFLVSPHLYDFLTGQPV